MDGFGERLRATREWLGITLDEVEAETKIRKLYIEALENENFAILPPQVYAIGFVKQYARVLSWTKNSFAQNSNKLPIRSHPGTGC